MPPNEAPRKVHVKSLGVFYFMYVVGEDVPDYDEWRRKTGKAG